MILIIIIIKVYNRGLTVYIIYRGIIIIKVYNRGLTVLCYVILFSPQKQEPRKM